MNANGRVNCSSSCKESVGWAKGSWSYSIPVGGRGWCSKMYQCSCIECRNCLTGAPVERTQDEQ